MALATVEKEILKVMNTSTTGLRNKMASKYIHDITRGYKLCVENYTEY